MKRKVTLKTLLFTFLLFFINNTFAQEPGQAYYFPGPASGEGPNAIHARINNTNNAFDFASGTIEGWIRPDFASGNDGKDDPFIFSSQDWWGKRWGIRIGKDYGGIGVVQGGGGWDTSWLIYKFEKGRWYHIAAVFNTDETISIYINGVSIGTSTVKVDLGATGAPFKIGISNSWDVNNIFKGAIDEVRVWNVIRTATEIKNNMNNTVSPASAGLLAYYNFTQSLTGDLTDLTANGLHGGIGYWDNNNLTKSAPNWVESYAMVVPQIQAPSNVSSTSFTINWQAPLIGTVNNYVVDVATDALFTNIISGYEALNVGNVLAKEVTGLDASTTYYYRVRANKSSVDGQGAYSVTSSININTVLPLTFLKVAAQKTNNGVTLTWQTVNEVNNSHFNVLHSVDNKVWNTIEKINAKGLSNNTYTYRHAQPTLGSNYYKLQQVDINGDFSYSEIKNVDFNLSGVKVYPNPVTELLEVQLNHVNEKNYAIYNSMGVKVVQGVINNAYKAIDVSGLAHGVYTVSIDGEAAVKIIKK